MSTLEKNDGSIEASRRLVEIFIEEHITGDKTLREDESDKFPFAKELFPSQKFSELCFFVKKESLKILRRNEFFWGDDGIVLKPELVEKLRSLFFKRVAVFIFNEGTMELNPLFQDLFEQANKKGAALGKKQLLLTKELKLDLFENYCLLCGNAILKELDSVIAQASTDANPNGTVLLMLIIIGITANGNNIKRESKKFFDSLDNNKEDDADLQATLTYKQLLEDAIEKLKDILEDYKTRLPNLSDNNSIYAAGNQLLGDAGKVFESAPAEVTGYVGIVVKYATEQLQSLIESPVRSSSVLPAASKKCSGEEDQEAKKKLQAAGYKEVVSSATKFLEAVATVIVKGIFLAMGAIANSAPFILAPCTDPPLSPTCGRRQTWSSTSRGTFLASKCSEQQREATTADQSNNPALISTGCSK